MISGSDWDRLTMLVMAIAALVAGTKVLLVLFKDPVIPSAPHATSDATQEGSALGSLSLSLSPFKAWLAYSDQRARLQAETELERYRIDRGLAHPSWGRRDEYDSDSGVRGVGSRR